MNLQCGAVIREIPGIPLTIVQKARWREWIAALKSGAYKQARHNLRIGDSYCCMGVACDLVYHDGWIPFNEGFAFSLPAEKGQVMSTNEFILAGVRRLYGGMGPLGFSVGGTFPDGKGGSLEIKYLALTALNDLGATFEEIAEILTKAMSGGYSYKLRLVELEEIH